MNRSLLWVHVLITMIGVAIDNTRTRIHMIRIGRLRQRALAMPRYGIEHYYAPEPVESPERAKAPFSFDESDGTEPWG